MKKLIAVAVLLASFAVASQADVYKVSLGVLDLQLPFQDGSAVVLYNILNKAAITDPRILGGFETTFGNIPVAKDTAIDLNFGVVTGPTNNGTPYGSLDVAFFTPEAQGLLSKIGIGQLKIGPWVGYDFNICDTDWTHHLLGGIKASSNIF